MNKKGMMLYYPVIFGIIVTLSVVHMMNLYKNAPKNTEFVGEVFLDSYLEIQSSFEHKNYVELASEYSAYNAVYPLAKRGFHSAQPCSTNDAGYVMWENIFPNIETGKEETVICYPTEKDIKEGFNIFLNEKLNDYLINYNEISIPQNNYDFISLDKESGLLIEVKATQKIIMPKDPAKIREELIPTYPKEARECLLNGQLPSYGSGSGAFYAISSFSCKKCPREPKCEDYVGEDICSIDPCNVGCRWDGKCIKRRSSYALDPSFEVKMDYDFIASFTNIIDKTKQIKKAIEECLLTGSGKAGDYDIAECTNIITLNKKIENVGNYEIIATADDMEYSLLFDVKDEPYINPYSDEKLIIKYALKFLDTFPPPATYITTREEPEQRLDGKYIKWSENPASDVIAYTIHAKEIIENTITGVTATKKPSKADESDIIDTVPKNILEWKIQYNEDEKEDAGTGLYEGKRYYVYIVAHDYRDNPVTDIDPVELTI